MYRRIDTPHIKAIDWLYRSPESFLQAQQDKVDQLGVGAAVFRTIDNVPYLLLIRRGKHDSLPGLWELPGGGIDDTDRTIKDAVERELKEETGLTASWVVQEVGHGLGFASRNGKQTLKITFVVECDEIARIEMGKTELSTEYERSSVDAVPVKLNPAEHDQYVWATRQTIDNGKHNEQPIAFTSDDSRASLLKAFDVQDAVMSAQRDMLFQGSAKQ